MSIVITIYMTAQTTYIAPSLPRPDIPVTSSITMVDNPIFFFAAHQKFSQFNYCISFLVNFNVSGNGSINILVF